MPLEFENHVDECSHHNQEEKDSHTNHNVDAS